MGEISRHEHADEIAILGNWKSPDRVFFYRSASDVNVFCTGNREEWRTQKRSHANGILFSHSVVLNAFAEIVRVVCIHGDPVCRYLVPWIEERYLAWSVFVVVERPGKGTSGEFCASIVEHYAGVFIAEAFYPPTYSSSTNF